MTNSERPPKPLFWVGGARKDYMTFPAEVKDIVGFDLYVAQAGRQSSHAKALQGFGGRGVLEVRTDHRGDTYRTVYTVKFEGAIYVLHAFQKKSKHGIATPQQEIDLVRQRLRRAEADYETWLKEQKA